MDAHLGSPPAVPRHYPRWEPANLALPTPGARPRRARATALLERGAAGRAVRHRTRSGSHQPRPQSRSLRAPAAAVNRHPASGCFRPPIGLREAPTAWSRRPQAEPHARAALAHRVGQAGAFAFPRHVRAVRWTCSSDDTVGGGRTGGGTSGTVRRAAAATGHRPAAAARCTPSWAIIVTARRPAGNATTSGSYSGTACLWPFSTSPWPGASRRPSSGRAG